MKKLVIKTALITVVSIIGAVIIAFGAFAMFAPKSVASFFDGVGGYSASVFFYERQYEKTGDFSDLVVLVDKIDDYTDPDTAKKYLKIFIEHQEFENYCAGKNATKYLSLADYYLGRYEDLQ